ncbi:MAG: hypothetical protein HC795_10250 [Coleofasciculaceae cyanobacterium RL_1_1]|nr:hypothetical protein [Coleofasciculaceae cyanobacterium RL_1_1]
MMKTTKSNTIRNAQFVVAAEVKNPLVEPKLVMQWFETGKDYPKLEARWVYEYELAR